MCNCVVVIKWVHYYNSKVSRKTLWPHLQRCSCGSLDSVFLLMSSVSPVLCIAGYTHSPLVLFVPCRIHSQPACVVHCRIHSHPACVVHCRIHSQPVCVVHCRVHSQPVQRSHMQRYYISHGGLLFKRTLEAFQRYVVCRVFEHIVPAWNQFIWPYHVVTVAMV